MKLTRLVLPLLLAAGLVGLAAAQKDETPEGAIVLKGHTEAVYGVAFSPDGKYVVTGSFDRSIKVFEAATGKEFKSFAGAQGHQNLVIGITLSADGSLIASASSDNTARVWDFPSSKALR